MVSVAGGAEVVAGEEAAVVAVRDGVRERAETAETGAVVVVVESAGLEV